MAACAKEKLVLRQYPLLLGTLAEHAQTCLLCTRTVQQLDEMAELSRGAVTLSPGQEEQLRDNMLARAERLVAEAKPATPRVWRTKVLAAVALLALALSGVSIWALVGDHKAVVVKQTVPTAASPPVAEPTPIEDVNVVAKTDPAVTRIARRDAPPREIAWRPRKARPAPDPEHLANATPTTTSEPTAAPPEPTAEQLYEQAWSALRDDSYAEAAQRFLSVTLVAKDPGRLEDAQFWHGASQALAGQSRAAVWTLRSFLAQYPSSPRAHEAASILGWQLLGLSEIDAAEPVLTFATRSPNPAVRDKARAGLTRVWKHHMAQ